MNDRFGAKPKFAFIPKRVYFVVILLTSVCIATVLALVGILSGYISLPGSDEPAGPELAHATVPDPTPVEMEEVLISAQRIASGSKVTPTVISSKSIPKELVPAGALLGADRERVEGMYARMPIPANTFLIEENLSEEPPIELLDIPPGYRATTIEVDARSGVEGYARPNTRVDILWLHQNKHGEQQLSTIVPYARVLSVAGRTEYEGRASANGKSTTVTLLVTAHDARRVELARNTGTLTLSLVGEKETIPVDDHEPLVTYRDLLQTTEEPLIPLKDIDGLCSVHVPETGERVEFRLTKNRWELNAEEESSPAVSKAEWLESKVPGFTSYKGTSRASLGRRQ